MSTSSQALPPSESPIPPPAQLQTRRAVPSPPGRAAVLVAAGILLSRVAGLIRERAFAHYFGSSDSADAFKAAQKIPNFLQNLFGEGVLSSSFIPVYARLLGEKNNIEANRVAGAIATLLAIITSILALVGVLLTPVLIDVIAPGFVGEKRLLTIRLVKILFPGIAVLVMSAWCLDILNSHRRFFLSYVAPVVWNGAIIGVLLFFGRHQPQGDLAVTTAWGLVLGCILQLVVQLPTVLRLLTEFRPSLDLGSTWVRQVLRNFGPMVIARGVVQVSAYIDNMIASLLSAGAVAALGYAQTLALLPVSLFGMSVAAVSLTEMSRSRGEEVASSTTESQTRQRAQLNQGLLQIAFFVVPSMIAFIALGDVVIAALYKTGKFGHGDVVYVWAALAGSALGLLSSTLGRLYASTFYALGDTRSPLRIALLRIALATLLGYVASVRLPSYLGLQAASGIVCLTTTSSAVSWLEFFLLRRKLSARIGPSGLPWAFTGKVGLASLLAGGAGLGIEALCRRLAPDLAPYLTAIPILGGFGAAYLGMALLLRVPQAQRLLDRALGKLWRRQAPAS